MRAPNTMADRWDALKDQQGDDGVRVQEILCEDGQVRYAVYINGTGSADNGNFSLEENFQAFPGGQTSTENYLRDFMKERIPDGADVMIHGYSQGGIYAQYIAKDSPYNVTDVVTYGSPYVTDVNTSDGQNIIRIGERGDPISGLGAIEEGLSRGVKGLANTGGKIIDAWRAIFGDMDGAVQNELRRMEQGLDITVNPTVLGVKRGLWGSHTDRRTYLYGSRVAERVASSTRQGRRALASMDRYKGTILRDSDSSAHAKGFDGGFGSLIGVFGSGFSGADVEQLLLMAKRLEMKSQALGAIVASSSAALMMAEWTGADIDQIRSVWNRQSKPAMQRTTANLAALAIELRKHAEQQRAASGRK